MSSSDKIIKENSEKVLSAGLIRLESLYQSNPRLVNAACRKTLASFGDTVSTKHYALYLKIEIALILLMGLPSISAFMFYLFGFLFFVCGYFINTSGDKMSLLFLFSHGLTGYLFMVIPIFVINSNLNFGTIVIAIVTACFALLGFMMSVIYNLNGEFKLNKMSTLVPMIFIIISFVFANLIYIL